MTRDEADTILYLVDELTKRGAVAVNVAGVSASFVPAHAARQREPRKEKTFRERLFGPLGMDTQPRELTRQERLKRRTEA